MLPMCQILNVAYVTDTLCLPLCQMLGPESEWHHMKQMDLRQRVMDTKDLTVKTYKEVDDVCSYIKKVSILAVLECYVDILMEIICPDCIFCNNFEQVPGN